MVVLFVRVNIINSREHCQSQSEKARPDTDRRRVAKLHWSCAHASTTYCIPVNCILLHCMLCIDLTVEINLKDQNNMTNSIVD